MSWELETGEILSSEDDRSRNKETLLWWGNGQSEMADNVVYNEKWRIRNWMYLNLDQHTK